MTYADDLRALATELREIAELPPVRAMVALGQLVDYAGGSGALDRLRAARRRAAVDAVAEAGSQAALARALGVSEMAVSRAVRGTRRHAANP